MRRRKLWLAATVALLALVAACLRIRYVRLGWGGYWTVDLSSPLARR